MLSLDDLLLPAVDVVVTPTSIMLLGSNTSKFITCLLKLQKCPPTRYCHYIFQLIRVTFGRDDIALIFALNAKRQRTSDFKLYF